MSQSWRYKVLNKRLRWLFLLSTLFLCAMPLRIELIGSILRLPAMAIIVFIIFDAFSITKKKYAIPLFVIFAIIFFHLLFGADFTYSLFMSSLCIVLFLLLVITSASFILDDYTISFIHRCGLFSFLALLFFHFWPMSHSAEVNPGEIIVIPYLTYGFNNSNFAGIITFLIFSIIFVTIPKNVTRRYYFFYFVIEAILLYFIYETNTRTALVSALIVPILGMLFRNKRISSLLLWAMFITPFAFVPLYLMLSVKGAADDTTVMGKEVMSGRDDVFLEYLGTLRNSEDYLFGNLADNGFMNAHNGPLAIFVSIGIVGTIAFFCILISRVLIANRTAVGVNSKISVFVIASIFITSCGEAALLLGGFPGVAYVFVFYIMAFSDSHSQQVLKSV